MVNQKGKHNRSLKVAVQGPYYYSPSLIHSFISIILTAFLLSFLVPSDLPKDRNFKTGPPSWGLDAKLTILF
jgi:hypothetical protein